MARSGPKAADLFKSADADADGLLTQSEFAQGMEDALASMRSTMSAFGGGPEVFALGMASYRDQEAAQKRLGRFLESVDRLMSS